MVLMGGYKCYPEAAELVHFSGVSRAGGFSCVRIHTMWTMWYNCAAVRMNKKVTDGTVWTMSGPFKMELNFSVTHHPITGKVCLS